MSACRAREPGIRSWSGLWYPAVRLTCWKSRVNSRGNMENPSIISSRQVFHLRFYIMSLCSSLHWIHGTTRIHGRCVRGHSESILLFMYCGKIHLYLHSLQLVQFLSASWQWALCNQLICSERKFCSPVPNLRSKEESIVLWLLNENRASELLLPFISVLREKALEQVTFVHFCD